MTSFRAGPNSGQVSEPDPGRVSLDKARWRSRLLASRRARPAAARAEAQDAIAAHILAAATGSSGIFGSSDIRDRTVCVYLPLTSEPLGHGIAGALVQRGIRVLAPIARPDAPLDWCVFDGTVTRTEWNIDEPCGPRLGPHAICDAAAVFVPALAVDRKGVRLGRGGGHYDRTLALVGHVAAPRLIAIVYDDELVDTLPCDRHDVAVTHVVSPTGGYRRIGGRVAHRGPDGASLG